MANIIELFNAGGIPLVLVAAFLYFLRWQGKYFIRQIDAQTEERKELISKFEVMLGNHCQTVIDTMKKQAKVFELLTDKINGRIDIDESLRNR